MLPHKRRNSAFILSTYYFLLYTYPMGVYTDEELDELMQENLRLTKENNKLLKKMRRTELFGMWMRILFFLVIIGVPLVVYRYYVAPYIEDFSQAYQDFRADTGAVLTLPDTIVGFFTGEATTTPAGGE